MSFLKQQFKDQRNKFVLGNTFNNLSKKVLELEKEISSDKISSQRKLTPYLTLRKRTRLLLLYTILYSKR